MVPDRRGTAILREGCVVWFLAGLFIGTTIGLFIAGALSKASESEQELQVMLEIEKEKNKAMLHEIKLLHQQILKLARGGIKR